MNHGTPTPTYSRKKAILFVGPVLYENDVEKAGHDLYKSPAVCVSHGMDTRNPSS